MGQPHRITGLEIRQLWRDSQEDCALCNEHVGILEFSLDHIVALKDGGPNLIQNCQISHLSCNKAKEYGWTLR